MPTVLSDVIMPESILVAGVRGVIRRMNQRASNQAGYVQVNQLWTQSLRRYEVGYAPMALDAWEALQGLFEVTEGGAYGFLMFDPSDRTVATGEGKLQGYASSALVGSAGTGYGVPVHRIFKRYTSVGSSRTKDRRISRPKSTIAVTRGGSPVTVGVGAGNIAIDHDTGTVTFVADTSQAPTSITVGASTVLNYSSGAGIVAAMSVGQRLYQSGVTGTSASTLNGLSHEITAKGAASLTVSTSTTGLTVTGTGTSAKYPQTAEALAWTGTFYVPVHFESDDLEWELVRGGGHDSRLVAGPTVVLVENRE